MAQMEPQKKSAPAASPIHFSQIKHGRAFNKLFNEQNRQMYKKEIRKMLWFAADGA
jgi:hypothetical protein